MYSIYTMKGSSSWKRRCNHNIFITDMQMISISMVLADNLYSRLE